MKKLLIIVGLSLTSLCHYVHSADEKISCRISVVSFQRVSSNQSKLFCVDASSSEKKEVRVSSTTVLEPIEYSGLSRFSLCRKTGGDYAPLANVTLPDGISRAIVVLTPLKGKKLPYLATVVNGSLKKFPAGSRLFINMTPVAVRGERGEKPFTRGSKKNHRFVSKPRSKQYLSPLNPDAKALASQPVILEFQNKDHSWSQLMESRWFYTPTQRHVAFVYYDKAQNRLKLKSIRDTVKADLRDIAANRPSTAKGVDDKDRKSTKRELHPIHGKYDQ